MATSKLSKKCFNIFLGVFSLLLTSQVAKAQGPVQPEAMQFESIDVTDVVNLATGDFVYTIPIMNVPGPEGDFPIVLSYHSGIGPNQPATWVGLGWTLNPGAVNRTLSGYPDDYKGDIVKTTYSAESDGGGSLKLGAGWGPVGVNMTYDTESGKIGVNAMVSVFGAINAIKGVGISGLSLGKGIGADIDLSYGANGFSANASLSGSRGIGKKGHFSIGGGISAGTNGIGIGGGLSEGYGKNKKTGKFKGSYSLFSSGASLTSKGSGGSFSVAGTGFSSITSSGGGTVEAQNNSIKIPLPGDFWVSLGYSKWKWTLDETIYESSYGVLYQTDNIDGLNPISSIKNERHATEEVLFPSKDAYNVAAQGVSGVFQPMFDYTYELIDKVDHDEKGNLDREFESVVANSNNISSTSANFRFLDDVGLNFTNKGDLTHFDTEYDYTQIISNEYSSKKIEPVIASNSGKILGFKITMPDGMVYEFMQSVLNYYQYSETISNLDGVPITSENSLLAPFATSWLLTAIKGPDYVDRGSLNVDQADWGYWVKLTYSENMPKIWRAPYIGKALGSDNNSEYYSLGVRQDIQLESIITRTHTATFSKSFSKNGKSANVDLNDYDYEINPESEVQLNSHVFEGDYSWLLDYVDDDDVIYHMTNFTYNISAGVDNACNSYQYKKNQVDIIYNKLTNTSSVFFNSGVNVPYECPNGINYSRSIGNIIISSYISSNATSEQLDNVELSNNDNSISGYISRVEFDYDYSLRPLSNGSIANSNDGASQGSLTLKSVSFFGHNYNLVSPPYRFEYAYGGAPDSPYNPSYHKEHYDFWGSYRYTDPAEPLSTHRNVPQQDKGKADLAAAWSLTGIRTPIGAEIDIEYESDDFFFVNNTFYLADGILSKIDENNSTGNDLKLVDNISTSMLSSNRILISEEKSIEREYCVENIGGNFCITIKLPKKYTFLGPYNISSIDDVNDILTLEENNPVFQNDVVNANTSTSYEYYMISSPDKVYGGGSRVKSITTKNGKEGSTTLYTYTDDLISSGVTASLPADYSELGTDPDINDQIELNEEYKSIFMDHKTAYGRPNPGVIYSKVQVLNVDENFEPVSGMTEYEFYTARDFPYSTNTSPTHFYIEDRSGMHGKPKSVTYFEQYEENGINEFRPIKKTENLYAFSDELFDGANLYLNEATMHTNATQPLGVTQQKHASYIAVDGSGTFNDHKKVVERTYFNVFGTEQKVTEYFYDDPVSSVPSSELTSNGKTIGFDVYTGSSIITAQQSATNTETIVTQTKPAWWKYAGMKDKNMLTQTFQETAFRVPLGVEDANLKDDFDTGEILSSSVSTWFPWYVDWNGDEVWRKNDTYSFVTDSMYVDFPEIDPGLTNGTYPSVTTSFPWKKTSDIVEYDNFGHIIETVNEDGTYQSVIYDEDNESLVLAVVSNAKFEEVRYHNYEWSAGLPSTHRYTGRRSTTSHTVTAPPSTPIHGAKYKIGIWVRGSSATIDGVSVPGANDNSWVFFTKRINPNASVAVTGGYFDDISIIPEYASISYFSYDQLTWKVTAMTGPDHRTSFYEYDDVGRLIGVKDQDRNLIQTNEYNYGIGYNITTTESQYGENDEVTFELDAYNSNVTAAADFTWDFGDGIGLQTNTLSATHAYNNGGEFVVSVTFTDSEGFTRRAAQTITIGNSLGLGLTILRNKVSEEVGNKTYSLLEAYAQPAGGIQPYTYRWYMKEGGASSWVLLDDEENASVLIQRNFTNATNPTLYTLKLEVEDFLGEVQTKTFDVVNTNLID